MKKARRTKYQKQSLERKPRESRLPDIKATIEVLSRLEPHRFLKTKAENPKQILKKKLIR